METRIVQQKRFDSLDEFVDKSNSFFMKFLDSNTEERNAPYQIRFRQSYPDLAAELDSTITDKRYNDWHFSWKQRFPWDKLWEAYKLMSQLVFIEDPGVEGPKHDTFLIE